MAKATIQQTGARGSGDFVMAKSKLAPESKRQADDRVIDDMVRGSLAE